MIDIHAAQMDRATDPANALRELAEDIVGIPIPPSSDIYNPTKSMRKRRPRRPGLGPLTVAFDGLLSVGKQLDRAGSILRMMEYAAWARNEAITDTFEARKAVEALEGELKTVRGENSDARWSIGWYDNRKRKSTQVLPRLSREMGEARRSYKEKECKSIMCGMSWTDILNERRNGS
jgi:hypothetical protein